MDVKNLTIINKNTKKSKINGNGKCTRNMQRLYIPFKIKIITTKYFLQFANGFESAIVKIFYNSSDWIKI